MRSSDQVRVDTSTWPKKLQSSRDAYASLRSYYLQTLDHQDEVEAFVDPLSESTDSPWDGIRKDELLRQEIFQDVDRCLPDNLFFRQPDTQSMLSDVLFTWAKLNPDVGYRQGMHEIAAPILWVVDRDAVDPATLPARDDDACEDLIRLMLDSSFIAHDTFTLFTLVMQNLKSSYEHSEQKAESAGQRGSSAADRRDPPIIERCREIMEVYLARTDPHLASYLTDIGIVPQVYLIRWIRLLFGREFSFDQTLQLWDKIFAEDHSALCIDLMCVAMLLRIRWDLLDADYNTALQLLLKYPELPPEHSIPTLVDDALYLKTHLNTVGGRDITSRRTGRRPPLIDDVDEVFDVPLTPATQPPQGNSPTQRLNRMTQHPAGLEGLLEDAARGIFSRGERWGLSQAVRGVVGEVRKNVQQVQSRTHSRIQSRSGAGNSQAALLHRLEAAETRNQALGKMLENAVGTLWEGQRTRGDLAGANQGDIFDGNRAERLTAAIAKVQLVSVYLADPSLTIPAEEGLHTSEEYFGPTNMSESQMQAGVKESHKQDSADAQVDDTSAGPGTQEKALSVSPHSRLEPPKGTSSPPSTSTVTSLSTTMPAPKATTTKISSERPSRPSLSQSQFSWMLGQDPSQPYASVPEGESRSTPAVNKESLSPNRSSGSQAFGYTTKSSTLVRKAFMSASPFREGSWSKASARSSGGKGYLFGDDDEEVGAIRSGTGQQDAGVFGSPKSKGKGKGNDAEKEKAMEKEARRTVLRMNTLKGKGNDIDSDA